MNLIILIVSALAIVILIMAFIRFRVAVLLYVAYQILVPYLDINIAGVTLSYNLVNLVLLMGFLYNFIGKGIKIDFSVVKPFFFFMLLFLVFMPFQRDVPLSFQFNAWRSNFMLGIILPLIIWNMALYDDKFIKHLTTTLIISIVISCVYGLVLTQLKGVNPYMISVLPMHGGEFALDSNIKSMNQRIISYVQSTFGHPMAFGIFLLSAIVYLFFLIRKTNKRIFWIIAFIVILNILFAGVRSTIMAAFVGLVYYLIKVRQLKLTLVISLIFIIFLVIVSTNESLSKYFSINALFESNNAVAGSSIEGRISQFKGFYNEIINDIIIGKGYSWNGYYLTNFGNHPTMLAFESLFMIIVLNNGIIGLFIWGYFILDTFRINKTLLQNKEDYYLINVLLILYLAYTFLTGDYGYMKFYMMFYAIIFASIIKFKRDEIKKSEDNSNLPAPVSPAGGE